MAKRGAIVISIMGDDRHLQKTTKSATSTIRGMRGPALAVGAGIGAVIASSVNLEKQFSQSMNMIAATTGAPKKEMAKLQGLAIQLGKDTSFSANEAGEAMLELAKGGLSAADIKAGALKGTLQLAAAGGVDLATAAGIAANALNTFGLKGKDMAKVSAALAGGANASTASVESLGQALSQVGPGARNAGLDINDTVGALAAFDSAGIKGSDAGTSLKTMLSRLVPNTEKARDAMKDLGLKFTDANGKFKPLTNIAQQLKEKMGGLSQEQRTLAMNTIFGSDATRAATVLMNEGGKGLGKYIKATKDRGAAEDAANARMKGTAGALERLSGSWETLRLTIGLMVAPAVSLIADKMSGLTNFLTENSKAVLIGVGVVGAFAAAILVANVAISVAGTVTKVWAATTAVVRGAMVLATGAQWAFNAALSANPIGLVVAAVAALVAGLVWFFTKTKTGQKIVRVAWGAMKAAVKGVVDWWTQTAWPAIRGFFRGVGRVIGNVVNWVKKNWPLLLGIITGPIGMAVYLVIKNWKRLKGAFSAVYEWIKRNVFDRFKLGLLILRVAFRLAKDKIASIFAGLKDRLGSIGKWIRDNVFGRIRTGLGIMKAAFRTAKDGIAKIWANLKKAAASPVNFVIKTVWNNGLRKVLNAIPGVDLKAVDPIKFAKGGAVTGGIRGRDSVPAMYMPGEHVWTEKEVRAVGGQRVMYGMRKAALDGRLEFAKGGALDARSIAKAQAFARQQAGKPYGWGAVGPSSYDCSGFMSALTNVLRGRSPYSRVGSTASFPWSGFVKGPGQFTIGSSPNFSGGIGHMSGNLAGLGVESRGGRGVILGSGAMSPSRFPQMYHLGAGGKLAGGGGGNWWDNLTSIVGAIKKLPGQIREMMSSGSWIGGFLKKMVVAVSKNVAKFINNKIPNGIPFVGDNPIKPLQLASGGVVKHRPGGVLANIGEGRRDEAVIPLGRGGAPARQVVDVNLDGVWGKMILRELRKEIGGRDPVVVLRGRG